ncbi:hypothetical protein RE6C_03920 [Rhodopirellula europaea 6C]|uniref:Uncharacterized protein n=1 Tax=Rhodopirellula europaea 6C TaxID=1263867 RepID=M2AZC9_9BACT|nr:hypothetical protein RE6C_03920 [Rhodopirellula europaea 6C]
MIARGDRVIGDVLLSIDRKSKTHTHHRAIENGKSTTLPSRNQCRGSGRL